MSLQRGFASHEKIIAVAMVITAAVSVIILQFRPTGNVISGDSSDSNSENSLTKSYADAGDAEIENGKMKQADMIIYLGH